METIVKVTGSEDGSKPPLFFVHGAWHGAWCWKPLMEYLATKGFTSYALDLPGHGSRKSEGVAGRGIMDYVSEVESSIRSLGLVKPVVIGHSMGGLIVQKFLEKNDALAAILIAPCPGIGGSLLLPVKYFLHAPDAGLTVMFGRTTAIKNEAMCQRLFFDDIHENDLKAHFEKLDIESSSVTISGMGDVVLGRVRGESVERVHSMGKLRILQRG